jgi:hypothetical protein
MSNKPNLKRENTLKVPLNDAEQDQIRKFCSGVGQKVAPFVRDLVTAHIRQQTNRTVGPGRSEGPRRGHIRGHVQRFPGRANVAGRTLRQHL